MASSLYNLALDFSKELNYTKAIMARQGDKGITVTVKPYLNGLQMDTSGGTFTLKGTTPSNRYVDSVATSVTSEEVTFSLDGTFMSEAGYYKHCYVEYRKDNQILTTQDIIFFSLGVSDISQGQADEYVSQLEELIRKYNETFDAFMAETKGRVDSLNQQITDLTGQAKTLQDKLDALKEEISKLGNLQVMYSNSIDFGGYDYSGNPNLMKNVYSSTWSKLPNGSSQPNPYTKIFDDYIITDATDPSADNIGRKTYVPTLVQLQGGKEYTISVTMMVDEAFNSGGDSSYNNSAVHYAMYADGQEVLPVIIRPNTTMVNQYQRVSATFTMPTNIKNVDYAYFFVYESKSVTGKWYIKNDIKIEEGPTATPFQPNLLAEPYNMCPEYPNENIVNPTVKFPIITPNNPISGFDISEELIIGETYTVSLKGTKPANKEFHLYYGDANYQQSQSQYQATLLPVEGLANVWSATFTARNTSETTNLLRVALWQKPNSATYGTVQIDWLKIEKGNTRTPNISEYKYRGTGMRDSNNPKDYVWDLAPEYVEDNLATDIKISEITGKANNYTDGKVSEINSQLTASINEVDTTAKGAQTKANANATAIDELDNKIDERINDTATTAFYGAQGEVSNKTKVAEYGVGTGYTTTAVGETHFERQSNGYVKCLKAGKYSISAQIRVQLGRKYASWLYTDLYKDGTSVDNLVSYGVDALQNRFAASGNIVTDLEVNDVLNMRTEIGVADGILQFTSCRTLVLTRLSD
jgi:hypothetical protein